MSTETITRTSQNIRKALELMKTEGRALFTLYCQPTPGDCFSSGYCPLGALNAVRHDVYGKDMLDLHRTASLDLSGDGDAYAPAPEHVAVCRAIQELSPEQTPHETLVSDVPNNSHVSAIHGFNDETRSDDLIFAVMERAGEIATEKGL